MEKGRLEQQQAVAEAKAKEAAMAFQREQRFAKDVASGVPVMEAYQRNPVSSSVLNAIGRTQLKEGDDAHPIIREGKNPILKYNRTTGQMDTLYTPAPAPSPTEILKDLRHQRDQLEKATPRSDEDKQLNDEKISSLQYKIDRLTHGKPIGESKIPTPIIPGNSSIPTPAPTESKFGHPKIGEVRAGFKFIGGDPNDQKNWEPVKEGG